MSSGLQKTKKSRRNETKTGDISYDAIVNNLIIENAHALTDFLIGRTGKKSDRERIIEDVVGYSVITLFIILGLVLVGRIFAESDNWMTNETSPDEIVKRQSRRGLIASFLSTLIFGVVNGLLTGRAKCNAPTYQALVSMTVAGLGGFLFDNSIATEKGASIMNGAEELPQLKNIPSAFRYSFGTLWSERLPRYVITILLDVFISLILTDSTVNIMKDWYFFRNHTVIRDIVAFGIIGFITFIAYANATRLQWAYPPTESVFNTATFIPTSTILISSCVAAMVFLVWRPQATIEAGVTKPIMKLALVFFLFFMIGICYYFEFLDPVPDTEIVQVVDGDKVETSVVDNKPMNIDEISTAGPVGMIVFLAVAVILVTATMRTSELKGWADWTIILIAALLLVCTPLYFAIPSLDIF